MVTSKSQSTSSAKKLAEERTANRTAVSAIKLVPRTARILGVFTLLFALLLASSLLLTGRVLPGAGLDSIWFYSGIVMVVFAMFFIEPYYTAPKNVLAHSLAISLVLISVRDGVPADSGLLVGWRLVLGYAGTLLVLSLLAVLLSNRERSPTSNQNRAADILTVLVTRFGIGRIQYSAVFLLFVVYYHDVTTPRVLAVLIFWWAIVVLEPQKLAAKIESIARPQRNEIGEIIGVQSRRIFLAKLHKDRPSVRKFDAVTFCYSMDEDSRRRFEGIVFDSYLLNQERWVKILHLESVPRDGAELRPNAVYSFDPGSSTRVVAALETFVGVVADRSDISVIRFEYSAKEADLEEGDLVEVRVRSLPVYYQVVNGVTTKQLLEAKDEAGFIQGEAVQLGVWNSAAGYFDKFGWVPEINAVVSKVQPIEAPPAAVYPEYNIGVIPGTQLPSTIDLHAAISHHLAVLGVTGSGKSFITLDITRQLASDTKIICVDFTGEYIDSLAELAPARMLDAAAARQVEGMMAERADAEKARNEGQVLNLRQQLQDRLLQRVQEFVESEDQITIFELPDLSNTSFILEFTQLFLDSVFRFAKENPGNRICLVIEEAHTVVPETTSLGDLGDYGSNKALVNKIGQIALQGRKYGIGFIIVAQRTANVSKTVLTQCNSIIAFQAFDETSFRFLENHVGAGLVAALPKLKPFHAVVVGKAFRGSVPMIVDFTRADLLGEVAEHRA